MVGLRQGKWIAIAHDRRDLSKPTSLVDMAHSRLRLASYPDLRRVSCRFQDGVLTLYGQVPSYHLKQMAQTLVASLEGVRLVCNELDVGPWSRRSEHG